jgi:hypothetical protein
MYRKTDTLLLLISVFIMIGLLSALTPVSDFDQDGYLDSLVTEGFLLIPILYTVTGLFCLWIRLPAACLPASKSFSALIVPPPIPTE